MSEIRVRFAPSPTGPLHIGGLRTALYNYLFARKHNGSFILRIEDTDRNRYVEGAEKYILESLEWTGLRPDESPAHGGPHAPYRQSERTDIYQKYAERLIEKGHAYYAFDTPDELDEMRRRLEEKGVHSPKYDQTTRMDMKNSLTLSDAEVKQLLDEDASYTIRMKVPAEERVFVEDEIRGRVEFSTEELDDKILVKQDGLPTYHLANVVDDFHMEISHVIRGEEWLSSTGHHLLLYRFLAWEDDLPNFAHLPLILKPEGKGKLSKRDGEKLGIPVFPLNWTSPDGASQFSGFREAGYLPEAVVNFLAFLGWNPGTEKELFEMDELIEAFSLDQVSKSGARFDIEKAQWFNQQYILRRSPEELVEWVERDLMAHGVKTERKNIEFFCTLFQPRVTLLGDFWEMGKWCFQSIDSYDEKMIRKKWKEDSSKWLIDLSGELKDLPEFDTESVEKTVKGYIEKNDLGFGRVLPLLRLAISGTMQGPDLFPTMVLLGRKTVAERLKYASENFSRLASVN